jgi:hypothetical protein
MIDAIEIQESQVSKIWAWYQEAMWKCAGRKVNMPGHTDPKKTYQYRWMSAFVENLKDWQITSDDLIKHMVFAVVRYARDHKLLRMGASILAMQKVLEICHNSIQEERKTYIEFATDLQRSRQFLLESCGSPFDVHKMTTKEKPGGYANVIFWLKSGRISTTYLCLSNACHKALAVIEKSDPSQRKEIQNHDDLLRRRLHILAEPTLKKIAQRILGVDYE